MSKMRKRSLAAVAALLAVGGVFLAIQPGLALTASIWDRFFGPNLVRAEIVVKKPDGLHDYRVDRGRIRAIAPGSLTLLERDGTTVTVPIALDARVQLNGRPAAFAQLRRRMVATTIRDNDAPAAEVQATGP
jgi:hypothetical protein